MTLRPTFVFELSLGLSLLVGVPALFPDDRPVSREEFEKVRNELEALKRNSLSSAARPELPEGAPKDAPRGDNFSTSRTAVYDKPFLKSSGPRTYVGGYFEAEFRDEASRNHDFSIPRLVPFFVADLHDRVRFASEFEIENSGEEVEVEFAVLDLHLFEPVNLRGGVILDPLGRFNLYHDSPIYDLTDRPLVDQFVIPTTLREVGAGLFGSLSPVVFEQDLEIKYEAYVTSGFKGLSKDPADDPAISIDEGLREARAHEPALGTGRFGDNNNSFAGVGRLSVSPFLGSELGASVHHGAYDAAGDNALTIAAVDGLFKVRQFEVGGLPVGPIEVQGEGAYAFIERNAFARSEGVPGDFWGYYAQLNYHFLPEYFLPPGTRVTTALFPDSIFTLVGQWNHVNLDGNRLFRCTVGLNFRPVESTVFKFDYQFNQGTGKAPDSADLDAFIISVASYF